MQHEPSAVWVLAASASLLVTACATSTEPDLDAPGAGSSSTQGGGGRGGAVAGGGAFGTTSAGKAGTSNGGSTSGVANGGGGSSTEDGGKGGEAGSGATTSGGRSGGGTGGKGGADTGGKGGTGGAGGRSGSGGSGGAGGRGGNGGSGGAGGGDSTVNLVTNPGFEGSTTGWSVFGGSATISSTTDEAHSGTRSLMITGRTQPYQGPQYSVLDDSAPGTSYSLSLWGRLPASNPTGSLTVTLHYTCSGGSSAGEKYLTWVATAAASASNWIELSATKTFPACAGGGSMTAASFYVESPSATLAYYIDDVVFTAQ